jgi:hypothetical protein
LLRRSYPAGELNTLPDYGEVFFSSCEAYLAGPAGTVTGTVDGGTGDNLNIIFPYPGGKVTGHAGQAKHHSVLVCRGVARS